MTEEEFFDKIVNKVKGKRMTHKYKVGDEVVYIAQTMEEDFIIRNDVVQTVIISNEETRYNMIKVKGEYPEYCLYTPKEALEFITNYINKTEE